MNADDVRAYKKRWELVAEVERAELARMTYAQKFADTALLMDVAWSLGRADDVSDSAEVEEVRRRWNRLAELMGV